MDNNPEERTEIYFKRHKVLENQNAILNGKIRHYNGQEVKWTGSERNKELIFAFQRHLFAKGNKQYRIGKLTWNVRKIIEMVGKDLDRLTKDDAEGFLAKVNSHPSWSPHTKRDYIRNFKQFFLWFEEDDPRLENGDDEGRRKARKFYKYVRKISTAHPRKVLDYATIITETDCKALVKKGCQNSLERAMVAILHETGVRVGELLGMRLRDIERKGQHAMVRVDGKTGERRVPILQSIPRLEQWLMDHPVKDNQNALLWVSTHNGHRGEALRHIGVRRLLQRVMERSGLKKRCNPHWFRHSRATILAPLYGEQVLCKLMGWELGSKQVRTYVHLGAEQVEKAFKEQNGLRKPTERKVSQMQECVCTKTNEPEARYCYSCGRALSVGVMLEDEEHKTTATEEAMRELVQIAQNPERLARFQELLKAINGGSGL